MRTHKCNLTIVSTWMFIILWAMGIVLSAVPERRTRVAEIHEVFSAETLEAMPILMVHEWRKSISVRVDPASSKSKKNGLKPHDLKKFHAALAPSAPTCVASTRHLPHTDAFYPVPASWYGFSSSSRSPPLSA